MKPRIYITTYNDTSMFIIEKILNNDLDTIYFNIDKFISNNNRKLLGTDNINYLDDTVVKILRFKNTKLFYEI